MLETHIYFDLTTCSYNIHNISDGMNYFYNRYIFEDMITAINSDPYIQNGSVNCWLTAFHNFLLQEKNPFITQQLDEGNYKVKCYIICSTVPPVLSKRQGEIAKSLA